MWVLMGLTQLNWALKELRDKHSLTLGRDPGSLWGEEIVAATDHEFWPVWRRSSKTIGKTREEFVPVRDLRTSRNLPARRVPEIEMSIY